MEDRKWANKSRFGGFAQLASSDMKPKPKLRPKSARGSDCFAYWEIHSENTQNKSLSNNKYLKYFELCLLFCI